jgi:spore maturation protein CgeB
MKLVVFGLSVTSAWGNGHATIWRGILRALAADGHDVVFFERDSPVHATHRELARGEGYEIVVYPRWSDVASRARREVEQADVAIVTSYQADAAAASEVVIGSRCTRVFYDLDTPVTLERLDQGELVSWLPPRGLGEFDLVLSVTGGQALDRFRRELGARRVAPLFPCADLQVHRPGASRIDLACDLSYLGIEGRERSPRVEWLLLDVANRAPHRRFLLGEVEYPGDIGRPNVEVLARVPPADHAVFYGSSRLTLNLSGARTAQAGFCPSARLFQAAACGVPVISDDLHGIEAFFQPGAEILIAKDADDVLAMLELSAEALAAIARSARDRVLAEHTAVHRARELIELARAIPRRASAA